ncbi:MAG: phosphoribosyltransferase [Planctomycetota bacterium]
MAQAPACLFSAEAIAARVSELAREIRRRFPDGPLTLLGVLHAAAHFAVDLARSLAPPLELTFVTARSYGAGTVSSGRVEVGELEGEVMKGRRVVVVDTVLDTGRTLRAVVDLARGRGAAEVAACVLVEKNARREREFAPDWIGFAAGAEFLVGYGLDHGGRYRSLPYIGSLDG